MESVRCLMLGDRVPGSTKVSENGKLSGLKRRSRRSQRPATLPAVSQSMLLRLAHPLQKLKSASLRETSSALWSRR
eukprot:5311458-Amphidinium_carterae.1